MFDEQALSAARAELHAAYAHIAREPGQPAIGVESLQRTVTDAGMDTDSTPDFLLARARRGIRATARSFDPHPEDLPPWAIDDLPQSDLDFIDAWLSAAGWPDRQHAIQNAGQPFPPATLRRSIGILAYFDPSIS